MNIFRFFKKHIVQLVIVTLGLVVFLLGEEMVDPTFLPAYALTPELVPRLLGLGIVVTTVAEVLVELVIERKPRPYSETGRVLSGGAARKELAVVGIIVMYFGLVVAIGYYPATVVVLPVFYALTGERRWPSLVLVPVLTTLGIYVIMDYLMGVRLPGVSLF